MTAPHDRGHLVMIWTPQEMRANGISVLDIPDLVETVERQGGRVEDVEFRRDGLVLFWGRPVPNFELRGDLVASVFPPPPRHTGSAVGGLAILFLLLALPAVIALILVDVNLLALWIVLMALAVILAVGGGASPSAGTGAEQQPAMGRMRGGWEARQMCIDAPASSPAVVGKTIGVLLLVFLAVAGLVAAFFLAALLFAWG